MSTGIPIFLSSDDNYAPFVATAIASMCYTTKSFLDFYILDGGISPFNKRQIMTLQKQFTNFSMEFINIDVEKIFSSFSTASIPSLSKYSRLLIPSIKNTLDKFIYSDVDVIALGDITEIYEQDLSHYMLGAVYHAHYCDPRYIEKVKKLYKRIDLKNTHKYFYAGNFLASGKKWRKNKIEEKLFSIAHKYKKCIVYGDQDVLNKVFGSDYKQLDYRFCLTTQDCESFDKNNRAEYVRLSRDVVIRHFETHSKPWLTDVFYEGRPLENFHEFWFFAAMTPFFHGLQQKFLASRARNEIFSYEPKGGGKKPDIWKQLRARIQAAEAR